MALSREGRDKRIALAAVIRDAAQRLAGGGGTFPAKKGTSRLAPGGQ